MRKSFSEDFWAPLGIPRPASDKDDLVSDGPTTIYSLELGLRDPCLPLYQFGAPYLKTPPIYW